MQVMLRGGKALVYFGLMLIIMGTLVFLFPKFFAYIFAGLVIAIGVFLFVAGLLVKPIKMPGQPQNPSDSGFSSYEEIRD
jgi:hypothetical protein